MMPSSGRLILIIIFLLSSSVLYAKSEKERAVPKYVGAKRCGVCHRGEDNNFMYERWQTSKHAQAFNNLPEAAQRLPKCLGCHTTGYWEQDRWYKEMTADDLRGVQCEACHGPGGQYRRPFAMSEKLSLIDMEKQKQIKSDSGLKVSTIKDCDRCHNENCPYYKPLVVRKELVEVAHPPPHFLRYHIMERFKRLGK